MIVPLPVKKDKIGRRVAGISLIEFYRQIREEMSNAYANATNKDALETFKKCGALIVEKGTFEGMVETEEVAEAEKLANIITYCITRLEIIGYDENKRQELYQMVNEKNCERGYFDD